MSEAKELSIAFRKESVQLQLSIIYNGTVEYVNHSKYLGMLMRNFSKICDIISKRVISYLIF